MKRSIAENKELEGELIRIKDELLKFHQKIESLEELSRKKEDQLVRECESLNRKLQDHEQKEIRLASEKKSLESMLNQTKEDLQSKIKENENVYGILEKRNAEIEDGNKEVKIK